MSSSNEYIRSSRAGTRRSFLLYLSCFLIGTVVGGFVVRSARPHREDATVISALGGATFVPSTSLPEPTEVVHVTTSTTSTNAPLYSLSAQVADKCNAPEAPLPAIPTLDGFRTIVVRTWMQCSSSSVFGTTGEIGLELLSDDTWYKLYANESGGLVRGVGIGRQGTWSIIDVSAMNGRPTFQLQLTVFGLGGAGAIPAFALSPHTMLKMRLNNMGVYMADYVAVPGAGA